MILMLGSPIPLAALVTNLHAACVELPTTRWPICVIAKQIINYSNILRRFDLLKCDIWLVT